MNKVVNPARANPYCNDLRFRMIANERSAASNKFLHYRDEPLLCVTFGVVQKSNLLTARSFHSKGKRYIIKDVVLGVFRHEWQRTVAFMAEAIHIDTIFFNGSGAADAPGLGICSRFVPQEESTENGIKIAYNYY